MAKDNRIQSGILGDISPKPGTEDHVVSKKESGGGHEDQQSMVGGSQHGSSEHTGSPAGARRARENRPSRPLRTGPGPAAGTR